MYDGAETNIGGTRSDIRHLLNNQILFGGAMILLAGDFRQTLPLIPRSTAADEINACLKASILQRYVQNLKLTTNMRVALQNDISASRSFLTGIIRQWQWENSC